MNDVREIVTKAVVCKGKKLIRFTDSITPTNEPYSILGCWIINHEYEASLNKDCATINGSYEINIWYAYDQNTKTDIARNVYNYTKRINTKPIVNNVCRTDRDCVVTALQQPTCVNAQICNENISVDVCLELLVEVIGETKIKVAILEQPECFDYEDDDFEDEINENFINEE